MIRPSLKTKELPQNGRFILNCRVPSLWPTYLGERRTTFAKAYELKVRCYGEHVGEHIGKLMANHWELKGNIVRTHWELGRNAPPPAKLEKKKRKAT